MIKKTGDGSKKFKGAWDSIHVVEVQEKVQLEAEFLNDTHCSFFGFIVDIHQFLNFTCDFYSALKLCVLLLFNNTIFHLSAYLITGTYNNICKLGTYHVYMFIA